MNATSQKTRPQLVTLAVILLVVVLAAGLVRKILGAQSYDFRFYIEFAATLLLEVVVVWFIFRGKNWARWVLIVVSVLGAVISVPEFLQQVEHYSTLRVGRYLIGVVADLIILVALFYPTASQWFRGETNAT